MIKADAMANVDVDALASAFNLDKADFLGRVIQVDDFGNDNIVGIICDEAFFQIYDNQFRFDEFYNARTMSWNEYLHVWQTFAVCPFANAVILATEESKPATAIALNSESYSLTGVGDTESITATITPADSTSKVSYASSDEAVFTIAIDESDQTKATLTSVAVGEATLTVSTDNGKKAEATVTVSAE